MWVLMVVVLGAGTLAVDFKDKAACQTAADQLQLHVTRDMGVQGHTAVCVPKATGG